jgi:polyisoprenyl-teichoic acid--peptidoglycan teichoic acid transferase
VIVRRSLVAALALVAGLTGVALAALRATPAASAPVMQIGRAHAEFGPTLEGDRPVFVLLLGSDARPGTPVAEGLGDSIQVLGINPAARRASLVGIPRDAYVAMPGGGMDKINAALQQGGPEDMVQAVEGLTGIRFDYYVLTGFDGFRRLIQDVGGLDVELPYAFQGHEGNRFEEGANELNGAEALEFARTRKTLTHGDFDRSMNQGRLLTAAFLAFREAFAADPTTLFGWLGAGLRNVETDVPLDELIAFAFTAGEIPPKRVTNLVAVGSIGTAGGVSVVNLPEPNPVFEDLSEDGFVLSKDIPEDAQPAG